MEKSTVKKRIGKLKKLIRKYNKEYYEQDKPSVSDKAYDKTFSELMKLEKKYPQYKTKSSPTQKIGGYAKSSFKKVRHQKFMYSIRNSYNFTDIKNFLARIQSKKGISYVGEMKIDGLSIELVYKKGKLSVASTRGDGMVGEDVTENVMQVKDIPQILNQKIDITVVGEIYISFTNFKELNVVRKTQGLSPFSNPRNTAAGTLRQHNPKIVQQRHLSSFMYTIVNPETHKVHTQAEALLYLKKLGFSVNGYSRLLKTPIQIKKYIDFIKAKRSIVDYPTDGVVIKVNSFDYIKEKHLSGTAKYSGYMVAYKYPQPTKVTTVIKIIYSTGPKGHITPVAVLEPITLDGTIIKKVNLYNKDFLKKSRIKPGSKVEIEKSGGIIPRVVKVI